MIECHTSNIHIYSFLTYYTCRTCTCTCMTGSVLTSGLMDQQTLSSNHSKMLDPQYIAGALKDGKLHVHVHNYYNGTRTCTLYMSFYVEFSIIKIQLVIIDCFIL